MSAVALTDCGMFCSMYHRKIPEKNNYGKMASAPNPGFGRGKRTILDAGCLVIGVALGVVLFFSGRYRARTQVMSSVMP